MDDINPRGMSRRSFVAAAAAGVAALGTIGPFTRSAQAQRADAQRVELAQGWDVAEFNRLAHSPAGVKQVYDVTPASGAAFDHIVNSFNGLQFGFGIPAKQIQIAAVTRGMATVLIFNDYAWQKYKLGAYAKIKDPKTGQPAERNIYYPSKTNLQYTSSDVESPDSLYADTSIQALQHRGLRLLGCHNASYFLAARLAKRDHLPQKEIFTDLLAHTLPGVLIVAAAVAAVALLQSEGHYSYLYI
ncbi:MAG: twin-arginine translocation signal domain-containing protein [Terriglobales bacterium]